jgi:hypothetical protein
VPVTRAWWRHDPVPTQSAPNVELQDELAGHDFSKATHLRQTDKCPDCGEGLATVGKVTGVNGTVAAQRCFTCGWPVEHSTKGMNGLTSGKADGASRQVATGGIVNNYQPQNTVAGAIRTAGDLR